MNVLMLLYPKSEVEYLVDSCTLRQGLEKMRAHGYTAIPVITKDGLYVGSVSEGDFLWYIMENSEEMEGIKSCEQHKIKEIIRKNYNPAVTVDVDTETLIERSTRQNFIPVTDDRGYFIGIVTRRRIIQVFCAPHEAEKVDGEVLKRVRELEQKCKNGQEHEVKIS